MEDGFVMLSDPLKIETKWTIYYYEGGQIAEWVRTSVLEPTWSWWSAVWVQLLEKFSIIWFKGQKYAYAFFITQPPYNVTLSWCHNACSSLWGTRERFTWWTRVSYMWLKKIGGEMGKVASALGYMKYRWRSTRKLVKNTKTEGGGGCYGFVTSVLGGLLFLWWNMTEGGGWTHTPLYEKEWKKTKNVQMETTDWSFNSILFLSTITFVAMKTHIRL